MAGSRRFLAATGVVGHLAQADPARIDIAQPKGLVMLFTGTTTKSSTVVRRVGAGMVAAVAIALVAVALRGGASEPMQPWIELSEEVRGTYRFDDGEYLTVFGSQQIPRLEMAHTVTALMEDGPDRYAAMDGGGVWIERDDSGAVLGTTLVEGGKQPRFAGRDPLYREEAVRFSSGDATLSGTLLLPTGDGPHPAVALAHGAGPVRRQDLLWLEASHLARRGVAALVYDKRGVGESTGDYASATFDDLTADLLAAVAVLTDHPAIDRDRVGVTGFSQGGWLVAKAAQATDDIAFAVAYSPSGVTPADQQAWLHGSMLVARGFDQRTMTVADRVDRMLYSSLDLVEAGVIPPMPHVPGFWFHALELHMDSAAVWEGVRQPVLAVWGELDCQVPAHDSARVFTETLRRGGNSDATIVLVPGGDHSFTLVAGCGYETGLADHGELTYADGVLGLAAGWITALPDSLGGDQPTIHEAADSSVLGWHLDPPAPAPWYGTLAAQIVALLVLIGTFGTTAVSWGLRRDRHLLGATALAGLVTTVIGFAAFAEIAMLGDTHAMFLVGGPTVQGSSALYTAGRILVTATVLLAGVSAATTIRARHAGRRVWLVGAGVGLLVLWAFYWQLLPV
jgi:uncharacterized protein